MSCCARWCADVSSFTRIQATGARSGSVGVLSRGRVRARCAMKIFRTARPTPRTRRRGEDRGQIVWGRWLGRGDLFGVVMRRRRLRMNCLRRSVRGREIGRERGGVLEVFAGLWES
jgi:hypothetical protein